MKQAEPHQGPAPDIEVKTRLAKMLKRFSSKKILPAIFEFVAFQIPAVAVTVALLVLYIRQFTWSPEPNQRSALLFAARIHEALIVASLFQILYYHIRRRLLGSRGIPFGFLPAAFQLGSPFYMLSSGFWAPLVNHTPVSFSSIAFAILLVASFTLAALAGASSGVVMLPTQGWHELPSVHPAMAERKIATRLDRSFEGSFIVPVPFTSFIVSPATSLYPSVVDTTSWPQHCLAASFSNGSRDSILSCPFINWVNWGTVAYRWLGDSVSLPGASNLTVALEPLLDGTQPLLISYKNLRDGSLPVSNYSNEAPYSIAAATCPLDPNRFSLILQAGFWPGATSAILGLRYPVKLATKISDRAGNNMPVKQPRVIVQCSDVRFVPPREPNAKDDLYNWHFSPAFYPPFNITMKRAPLLSTAGEDQKWGFMDIRPFLPHNITVSAAFWTRQFRVSGEIGPIDANNDTKLCLVDARWIESEVWTTPLDSPPTVQHTVSITGNTTLAYLQGGDPEQDVIQLALPWLNLLNASLPTSALDAYNQDAVQNGSPDGDDEQYVFDLLLKKSPSLHYLPDAVAVFLADILAHVPINHGGWAESVDGPNGPWMFVEEDKQLYGETNSYDSGVNGTMAELRRSGVNYAKIEVGFYHNVYGYSFDTTATLLSWAVLLLHLLLVLIHLITVIVNKGWSSGAWTQLGELIALAANSTPPEVPILKITGTGVDRWKTWRLRAFVREGRNEDRRVELVLREEKILTKTTGSASEEGDVWSHKLGRMTETDRKYG